MPSFLLSPGICREQNSHGPAYMPLSWSNQTNESSLADKNTKANHRVLEERGKGEKADRLGYQARALRK